MIGALNARALHYAVGVVFVALIALVALPYFALLTVIFLAGTTIIGSQTGLNGACGKLYPARMRTSGIGWAIGIGRIGSIVSPIKSYEHENEVRAVIWSPSQGPKTKFSVLNHGFVVPVGLSNLIREVYVSPYSSPPAKEIVEGLLSTYGITVPILESDVNAPPAF